MGPVGLAAAFSSPPIRGSILKIGAESPDFKPKEKAVISLALSLVSALIFLINLEIFFLVILETVLDLCLLCSALLWERCL